MAVIGSASLNITPSFDGFQGKLEGDTSKAMTAAGVTGGSKFGDSAGKSAGTRFRSHIKSAAKIAALGLAAAGAVAFKFAGDAVAEARDAQKVGALTESTIKATGKAANVTAKQVGKLSEAISNKVGIDDEEIQAGANMLLTFKNIRNEAGEGNKIFDQTTRTLVDLSSAMGTDAKSSAIQLGKALNDPIKGVSALSRVGVTFTEQQKEQIKTLVEAGDTMGAQKIILRELKSEFGGAAKAQATEADKLSVAWGNFKEEIGTQLLPVMDDLANFLRKKGIPAARDFFGWVQDTGVPAMKEGAEFAGNMAEKVGDLVGFFNDLPKPAKVAALVAALGGGAALKLRGGGLGGGGTLGTVGRAVGLAKPVPVFVTNPGFGGVGGAAGAGGKATLASRAARFAGPVGVAAGGMYASKKLGINASGIPDASNPAAFAKTAAKLVEIKEHLFGSNGVEKGILRANDAASKLPNQLDQGKNSAQRLVSEVFDLKSGMDKIPSNKATRFDAPNLLSLLDATSRYKGMLDGLDGRTVTTFLKSVRLNNDIGESGDPRFGGFRAHGGAMHPGYSYRVGERGPETVTVGASSTVTPNGGGGGGPVALTITNWHEGTGYISAVADGRVAASSRHSRVTGRTT